MKVLIVDDVGYSRHYHARLLQKFGYEVETAENPLQALKTLERDMTIAVVLTDLMMREMDGVELFKRAQKINRIMDGGTTDPPAFILMTALRPDASPTQHKDLDKLRLAKDIGFVDVLYKPIEPEMLKNLLETINYARGRAQIDLAGVVKRVRETVDQMISERLTDEAQTFLDELLREVERLEQFVSEPVAT
jgi:CheY-like chemotaxis protein